MFQLLLPIFDLQFKLQFDEGLFAHAFHDASAGQQNDQSALKRSGARSNKVKRRGVILEAEADVPSSDDASEASEYPQAVVKNSRSMIADVPRRKNTLPEEHGEKQGEKEGKNVWAPEIQKMFEVGSCEKRLQVMMETNNIERILSGQKRRETISHTSLGPKPLPGTTRSEIGLGETELPQPQQTQLQDINVVQASSFETRIQMNRMVKARANTAPTYVNPMAFIKENVGAVSPSRKGKDRGSDISPRSLLADQLQAENGEQHQQQNVEGQGSKVSVPLTWGKGAVSDDSEEEDNQAKQVEAELARRMTTRGKSRIGVTPGSSYHGSLNGEDMMISSSLQVVFITCFNTSIP